MVPKTSEVGDAVPIKPPRFGYLNGKNRLEEETALSCAEIGIEVVQT
jgi:hypothetical protein